MNGNSSYINGSDDLKEFKHSLLWQNFYDLSRIPRGSKRERASVLWLRGVAEALSLEVREDAASNLVIYLPASAGREDEPPLCLQGHIDMVWEKDSEFSFDFETSPLSLMRDGDRIHADRTTLGADNGIAVAMMITLMQQRETISHPCLELCITVDEETGMTGARKLDTTLIRSKRMINLDAEEEGSLYIGCAGGENIEVALPICKERSVISNVYRLTVSGLNGGHSGIDIHLCRGNAIKLLAEWVSPLLNNSMELLSITGGDKRNAIPRDSYILVNIRGGEALSNLHKRGEALTELYRNKDQGIRFSVSKSEDSYQEIINGGDAHRIMQLVRLLPHGVFAYDSRFKDTVESSINLASIRTESDSVKMTLLSRSTLAPMLDRIEEYVASCGAAFKAEAHRHGAYPAWNSSLDSSLYRKVKSLQDELYKDRSRVLLIHAGLETGIFAKRFPDMEMVSIGPNIFHPHSPSEWVSIASVNRFFDFLIRLLASS